MKLHIKFIIIILGCLMATGGYAQKVIVGGGKVIIDASALRNSTTEKKATGTDATETTMGTNDASNISSKVSNETVYYKFEISSYDNMAAISWLPMVNHCKNLVLNGIGWRLPTIRELMLIYILNGELKQVTLPGFVPLTDAQRYWSATEESADRAVAVYLANHSVTSYPKTFGAANTRCIRDL